MTVGRHFILFTTHRAMLVRLASNAFYMLLWLCVYRVIKSEKEIPDSFRLGEDNPYDLDNEDLEFDMGMPDDSDEETLEEVKKEDDIPNDDGIDIDDI